MENRRKSANRRKRIHPDSIFFLGGGGRLIGRYVVLKGGQFECYLLLHRGRGGGQKLAILALRNMCTAPMTVQKYAKVWYGPKYACMNRTNLCLDRDDMICVCRCTLGGSHIT